jgi:hypothetical protein
MNRTLCGPLTAALAALAMPLGAQTPGAPAGDDAAWQPHRAIKVLYAGSKDGSRERAFAQFLGQHFDKVATIDLGKLSMATAADYDVVIADWVSQYGNDGYPKRDNSLFSAPIDLPESFTRPVIAMTYVGTNLRGQHKLDWL